MQRVKRKVLTHLYSYKVELSKYKNMIIILKLIQFLLLAIILVKQNLIHYLVHVIPQKLVNDINLAIDQSVFNNHLIVVFIVIIPLLVLNQAIHINFTQIELRISRFEKYNNKFCYLILALYFVWGIIQVPCLYQLGKLYSMNGNIQSLLLIFLNLVPFWPFSIIGYQYSSFVFDLFINLCLPPLAFASTNYRYFVLILPSLIYAFVKRSRFEKVGYLMIALMCLWNFLDLEFFDPNIITGEQKILFVCVSILVLGTIVFRISDKFIHNHSFAKNQEIFELIQKCQTQKLIDFYPFLTVFNVWQKCIKFTQSSTSNEHFNLDKKNINSITREDLIRSLMFHIEQTMESQKGISNRILYLKLKIVHHLKLIQIIEEIENLMAINMKRRISLSDDYLLLEFSKYVEDKLFRKGAKYLKTSIIIQKAILSEEFYSLAAEGFQKLVAFWEFLIRVNKSKKEVSDCFDSIITYDRLLRQKFEELSEITQAKKQRKLMRQIQTILNGHSIKSQFVKESTHDFLEASDRQDIDSQNVFILLEGNKIIKTSFEFLNDFGFSEDECFQSDKTLIFGNIFNMYFQQELRKVTIDNQRVFVMPVFNKNKQIMVKNCCVYIYPQLRGQVKYLVSFDSMDKVSDHSLVVYSTKSDSIEMVNQSFIEEFHLNRKKIETKILQSKLLSNQIFAKVDLSSSESKQFLKQQKHINCELIVKNFSLNSKLQKHFVNVSLITEFEIKNDILYMLSINKGNFIKTQITLTQEVEYDDGISLEDRNLNLKEFYKNQMFFCKINNSYSIKITEKQSQISQKNRKNFITYFKALYFIVALLIGGQIIYFHSQSESVISDISRYQIAVYRQSAQYLHISNMYSLFFQVQYLKRYPVALSFINSKADLNTIIDAHLNQISNTVTEFLNTYLTSLRHSNEQNIQYQIKFEYFSITTDTSKSTLIDYSEKFASYVKNSESSFLVENYLGFRELAKNFQNSNLNSNVISKIISSSYLTVYSLILILGVAMIVSCYLGIRIEQSINKIYHLLELISEDDSLEALKKVDCVKGKIKEMSSMRFKKDVDTQYSKYSTIKIIQFSDQLEHQQNRRTMSSLKQSQDSIDSVPEEQQPLNLGSESSYQSESFHSMHAPSRNSKELQHEPIALVFARNIYYLLLVGIFGVLIYLQISFLANQQQIFNLLLVYERDMLQSQLALSKLQNDFFFKGERVEMYNLTEFKFSDQNQPENMHSYVYLEERDQFSPYNPHQYSLLFSDVCRNPSPFIFEFEGLECSKIAGGILSDGLSQAFSMYFKLSNQIRNVPLKDFLTVGCENSQCPLFIEVFYLNIQLKYLLTSHVSKFREFFVSIEQKQSQKNNSHLLISFGMLFLFMVGFFVWMSFLTKRCNRAIKMFQIIPPEIMRKMKMTNYIRRNEILSSLSVL